MTVLWTLLLFLLAFPVKSDFVEMTLLSRRSTPVLNDAEFQEYVIGGTRDYDSVILFSFTKDREACVSCAKTNDAFVKTALRWNDMKIKDRRVVFLVITLDQGSELFDTLELEMVPTIVYLPESHAVDSFSVDERDQMLLERDDQLLTEGTIQRFVTKNTGVEFVTDSDNLLTVLVVVLSASLIVVFGYTYLFNNAFFYSFLGNRNRWYTICRYFLFFILSGILYDMLRGAPLVSVDRSGKVALFSVRGATIVEGLLYGVFVVAISDRFLHVLTIDFARKGDSSSPDAESPGDQLSFDLTVIAGCTLLMLLCFCVKTPWYLRGLLHL